MKRCLIFFSLVSAVITCERLAHFLTDGFYEFRITSDLPNEAVWEVTVLPPKGALDQTYHYLGCGAQSFVFESQDNQFVLKFFKHHRWRKNWINVLYKNMDKWEDYRSHTLMSAIYALKHLHNESLVEYVHLNRGGNSLPTVTFVDRMRRRHYLNLNDYQFIIQRKGCTLKERLTQRKKERDLEGARQDIRKTLELFTRCHLKGIKNRDPHMTQNFGFAGDKPMIIDAGAFWEYLEEGGSPLSEKELSKSVRELIKWTREHYPSLTEEIISYVSSGAPGLSPSECALKPALE